MTQTENNRKRNASQKFAEGIKYKILSKIVPFRAEEKQKQKKWQTMAPPISYPPNTHSLNLNPVLCSILSENLNQNQTKKK